MTVAKIAPSNFGRIKKRLKKKAGAFIGRVFPTQTERHGQIDYPAIPEALKVQKKRRKYLKEIMGTNATRTGK